MTSPSSKPKLWQDENAWMTENYTVLNADDPKDPSFGYDIVNRETGQVELRIDQLPQALMAILWLQEQYEEVMADPEREFIRRKPRGGAGLAQASPRVIN